MNAPRNSRRRSAPKATRSAGRTAGRAGTAGMALVLGCLSALGLWRCLDGGDAAEGLPDAGPARVASVAPRPEAIDVGQGQEADPTLLNEQALLESEEPAEEPGPAAEEPAPAATGDDEEQILARYPLHAVAFHFHTQVFAEPDTGSRVVGYARRGSTFRVGERAGTAGCPRGWHEIRGGGFICDGLGFNVGREPLTFAPSPPAARLEEALPYDYMHVTADHTPQYWKIPAPEEREEAEAAIAAATGETGAPPEGESAAAGRAGLERVLARASALAADAGVADAGPLPEPPPPAAEPDAGTAGGRALPAFLHMSMAKGFFVSVDAAVRAEDGAEFTRTVRSRYVPAGALAPAKPSTFEGVLVDGENPLPLVFVVGSGVTLLQRKGADSPLSKAGPAERYGHFPFLGRERIGGKQYVKVGENLFLAARVAAVAEAVAPPEGLAPGERWIDVSLGQQTLVAYEGETPVFATLVATGRKDFETPTGEFRIYGKHVTITMDDTSGSAEDYSIEDVPWTQYFKDGYAFHAAFWHDRFGRVRSHGCVNLSPGDARRLFHWTGPILAPGLHGAVATRANPGTRVVIRD